MEPVIFWDSDKELPESLQIVMADLRLSVTSEKKSSMALFTQRKGRLCFELIENGQVSSINFDFIQECSYHKRQNYSLKKEPLSKALGIKKGEDAIVWDICCGTGKDAMLMLSFGHKVRAFERSPIVGALLKDAHQRALKDPIFGQMISERFSLEILDPRVDLDYIDQSPDVIYLDPMYPAKKKSALPRKEMLVFQKILEEKNDEQLLFAWATTVAKRRVVVKRFLHAPDLFPNPSVSYKGKSTRYDMYIV